MAELNLGKVSVRACGEWDATVEYEILDVISVNKNTYLVKQNCQGIQPPNDEYYQTITDLNEINDKVNVLWGAIEQPQTWRELQLLVQSGHAKERLSLGDQFKVTRNLGERGVETLNFMIVDFDKYLPEGKEHSIVLMLSDIIYPGDLQFDAAEALFCAPNEMVAGDYWYTYEGTNYGFTLSEAVPKNGVITYNQYTYKISAYENQTSVTPLFTITATPGKSTGTQLVIPTNTATANANITSAVKGGRNIFGQSALYQWLNAVDLADIRDWWKPTNPFDRPPQKDNSKNSSIYFQYGIDPEFLNAVQETNVPCVGKQAYSISDYSIKAKFFPPLYQELQRNNTNLTLEYFKSHSLTFGFYAWLRDPENNNNVSVWQTWFAPEYTVDPDESGKKTAWASTKSGALICCVIA